MTGHRLTGLLPWLLSNTLLLITGVSGEGSTEYYSTGDTASLPCKQDAYSNCSSVTWNWNDGKGSFELVTQGKVKNENQEKSGKLRMGPGCSLYINNLTNADTGRYYCRLYHSEQDYTDAPVIDLSILHIPAHSPVTQLKIGSTITLHCHLHSIRPCTRRIRVTWVSETGAPLQGDRYKVTESGCSSSLTVTLERSDHNMKWECQLTVEGELKASHSYTPVFPVSDENMTAVWIGSGVAVCAAIVLMVILMIICKRRTVQRETAFHHASQSHTVTDQSKGESEDTVTYAVVSPSAAGNRKPDRENVESHIEYATIKTSKN